MRIKLESVASLVPHPTNPRRDHDVHRIAESIRAFGFRQPVVVYDGDGHVLAGHGRLLAARELGLDKIPVHHIAADELTPSQAAAYRLADNRSAEGSSWDDALLLAEIEALGEREREQAGFDAAYLEDLRRRQELEALGEADPAEDDLPETPAVPISKLGDMWHLGDHRLLCTSASTETANKFLSGHDLVLVDPPYCSGGFQESGRSAGSVGTSAPHKQIANDRLSTRGFQALLKAAVFAIDAPFFYVFTDWRMWTSLFDVAEGAGAAVRSMIVWNKQTPGMGRGWRSQHELVMWSCRTQPDYNKHVSGLGNVISLSRQPNLLHTTQKPVELIERLLEGAPFARTVADPMIGSGSTMIACEKRGLHCAGIELDPLYVDVAVDRWQKFTGKTATLDGTDETFDQVSAARSTEVAA